MRNLNSKSNSAEKKSKMNVMKLKQISPKSNKNSKKLSTNSPSYYQKILKESRVKPLTQKNLFKDFEKENTKVMNLYDKSRHNIIVTPLKNKLNINTLNKNNHINTSINNAYNTNSNFASIVNTPTQTSLTQNGTIKIKALLNNTNKLLDNISRCNQYEIIPNNLNKTYDSNNSLNQYIQHSPLKENNGILSNNNNTLYTVNTKSSYDNKIKKANNMNISLTYDQYNNDSLIYDKENHGNDNYNNNNNEKKLLYDMSFCPSGSSISNIYTNKSTSELYESRSNTKLFEMTNLSIENLDTKNGEYKTNIEDRGKNNENDNSNSKVNGNAFCNSIGNSYGYNNGTDNSNSDGDDKCDISMNYLSNNNYNNKSDENNCENDIIDNIEFTNQQTRMNNTNIAYMKGCNKNLQNIFKTMNEYDTNTNDLNYDNNNNHSDLISKPKYNDIGLGLNPKIPNNKDQGYIMHNIKQIKYKSLNLAEMMKNYTSEEKETLIRHDKNTSFDMFCSNNNNNNMQELTFHEDNNNIFNGDSICNDEDNIGNGEQDQFNKIISIPEILKKPECFINITEDVEELIRIEPTVSLNENQSNNNNNNNNNSLDSMKFCSKFTFNCKESMEPDHDHDNEQFNDHDEYLNSDINAIEAKIIVNNKDMKMLQQCSNEKKKKKNDADDCNTIMITMETERSNSNVIIEDHTKGQDMKEKELEELILQIKSKIQKYMIMTEFNQKEIIELQEIRQKEKCKLADLQQKLNTLLSEYNKKDLGNHNLDWGYLTQDRIKLIEESIGENDEIDCVNDITCNKQEYGVNKKLKEISNKIQSLENTVRIQENLKNYYELIVENIKKAKLVNTERINKQLTNKQTVEIATQTSIVLNDDRSLNTNIGNENHKRKKSKFPRIRGLKTIPYSFDASITKKSNNNTNTNTNNDCMTTTLTTHGILSKSDIIQNHNIFGILVVEMYLDLNGLKSFGFQVNLSHIYESYKYW